VHVHAAAVNVALTPSGISPEYFVATVELRDISLRRLPEKGPRNGAAWLTGSSAGRHEPFSIEHLNLTVPDGRTIVVLGPSGCGKTTILRVAAGLLLPDSGTVLFDGVDMEAVPPAGRGIGIVFQNYALYPFTSKRNILSRFLFQRQTPELEAAAAEKYRRTCELLGVEIEYLADRDTRNLSGGEKQRVALGRCITRDPRLFLLDEPFSSLDAKLRERYRFGLRKLLHELAITTIYVTHDQQEALILGDLVAVMNVGTIEQVGTPADVYEMPATTFVADFLNVYPDVPAINFLDGASISAAWAGRTLGFRPGDVALSEVGPSSPPATVTSVQNAPLTRSMVLTARFHGQDVYLRLPSDQTVAVGREIGLEILRLHVFDTASGRRTDTVSLRDHRLRASLDGP